MKSIASRYKILALVIIILIPSFSICVLTGWYFNISVLKKGLIGNLSVNPLTAFGLLLLITSFVISVYPNPKVNRWAKLFSLLVIVIGMVRLSEVLINGSTSISQLLFSWQLQTDTLFGKPNAMSPNTALLFVLMGISLQYFSFTTIRTKLLSDIFAVLSLFIAFLSIIGHLYQSPEFYFVRSIVPMALPTALCFCLFSVAMLLHRCESGLFRVLTSPYQGSAIARYLLPFAIIVPIAAGWLSLYGQQAELFSSAYGMALFSIITVVLLVLVIWQSAASINRSNRRLLNEVARTKYLSNQLHVQQQKAFEQALIVEKMSVNRQLIEATINGQEREKKQMGMELHDHINQILASTKLYLEMAKTDEKMRTELLDKSREQLSYAINEIRNLSKSMVLHYEAKGGIYQQMYEMVDHIQRSTSMKIAMRIEEVLFNRLEAKRQIAIYRIAEEQLNNIIKHAHANRISIYLANEDSEFRFSVEDNGKGFDPASKRKGIGLSNIQSRTEMLNGRMEIISDHNRGCKLNVSFPERAEMTGETGLVGRQSSFCTVKNEYL